jgi:phosphinothricin acetyltransferase
MTPTIRSATAADAAAIADIYAPAVERSHVTFETTTPSVEEMADRIRGTVDRYPWLVCECDGEVAGYAYANEHHERAAYQWGVDVSVYVHERWRRRGVARGLYESLFELLGMQGLFTAYAIVALPNDPSVALHESFGFERVGIYHNAGYKHGEWYDVGHWELPLRPPEDSPDPPTPAADLRDSDDWEGGLATGVSVVDR